MSETYVYWLFGGALKHPGLADIPFGAGSGGEALVTETGEALVTETGEPIHV